MNPCPCGFYGDKKRQCVCNPQAIARYLGKLSGPLLDRIDLHVNVAAVEYDEIKGDQYKTESSQEMYERVDRAVTVQKKRFGSMRNAYMNATQVEEFCALTPEAERIIKLAFEKLGLSMRGYHKILKIARTIADLEGFEHIDRKHIQEAIIYRSLDQKMD